MLSPFITTLPFAGAVVAVTVGVPSKLSLVSTAMMVAVSSTTETAVSSVISATAATAKTTSWLMFNPPASVAVKVRVSLPFQSAVVVIVAMPEAILTLILVFPETP